MNNIYYKEKIFKAFINGAKAVINKEKTLNEMNVFPVKDKDTGSNLRSLMDSILNRAQIKDTLKETLESISNAALIGSKGNSGLIFSQFIYGLSKDVELDYMDKDILINQIKKGYELAYQAIDMPVEGTMITIMRSWYNLLNSNESHIEFEEYLIESNKELQKSLENTKNLLPILKKNNVVDAGALAFTTFVDGFVRSIINDDYIIEIKESESFIIEDHYHEEIDITYRYCTEILIKTPLNKETIKEVLNNHGDSLVIGKSSEYYKIHIHTNEPDKVFEYISKYAEIVDSKIDDMKNQYMLNHNKKYDIAILTDSIADIKSSLIDDLQIHVFPVNININGTIYFDKRSISNSRILDLIKEEDEFPRSASPSTLSVIKKLEYLKKYYKKIIVLTVSSKMSSTHNIFKNAIKEIDSNDIYLIDSKTNSVSEGLIGYEIAKMINNNNSIDEIINESKNIVDNTEILVSVKSLDNMIRSGRISKGLGFIAKILNLKPIVSINKNGEGIVLDKVLGKKRSYQKILKLVKNINKKEGIKSYAISYVNNMKEAEILRTDLIKILGFEPEFITESSSVIAMNAGKDAVAIGFIKGERK